MKVLTLQARDRVNLSRDNGTQFLELCSFAGHHLEGSSPSASLVVGISSVNGIICMILAYIPPFRGGAWNEFTGTALFIELEDFSD